MLSKPLGEEQADMQARWSDPAYRWANDSNLRRKLNAIRSTRRAHTGPETLPTSGHIMDAALHSSSTETEGKGDKK
jgi:hypothetical protein